MSDYPTDDERGRQPEHLPDVQPVRLVTFDRYLDAQQAVDRLSDEGFPMTEITIVWAGLRQVEYVTGRRTVASAAREGLLSGAWFGLIIGLLFAMFAEPTGSPIGVVATYALTGALTVAGYQALVHWGRRGTRDFSTVGRLDAERYEVWVTPPHLARAQGILGITSSRSTDPEGDADDGEDE